MDEFGLGRLGGEGWLGVAGVQGRFKSKSRKLSGCTCQIRRAVGVGGYLFGEHARATIS